MKKRYFRIISLIMALVILIFASTACGKPWKKEGAEDEQSINNETAAGKKANELKAYTIKAIFPGDTPNDLDEVLSEVERQASATLNIKLDFNFYPWADYPDKIQVKMAAGENFDLHLNAPWLHMNQMIASNAIQAWDPYLEKYGSAILKAFPKEMIDANRFDGKIMGIPLGNVLSPGEFFPIRKDLREKYGLAKPKNLDELEIYLRKVKENEKGMIPITWIASQFSMGDFTDVTNYVFGQNNAQVKIHFNEKGEALPVVPIYEDKYFIDWCRHARQWYKDGLIPKNILIQKDAKGAFLSGRAACSNVDMQDEEKLKAHVPEGTIEAAYMMQDGQKAPSTFQMWNFLCLSTNSKDPERVTQFYNWIFEDQSHYDLLAYGIKDKHWVEGSGKTFDYPQGVDAGANYNFPRYVMLWNPNFERISVRASEDLKADIAWKSDPDNFVAVNLIGFTPDYRGIRFEMAKVSAIWPETVLALAAGVLDIDKDLPEVKRKLENAGYLKIVEEAERQIAHFLNSKK